MRLVSVEERIREAVNEALESGSQVVSAPGAQWIKHPDKGWDTFPPLYYVSKHCEPYLKKYYPCSRRSHVSRDATYTYLRTDRLMNPATTYGCRKDEGEYAAERLLNGVRVGEENLPEPLRLV
jgi:hypothetical protein